jgi:hypothetical protein
MIKNLLVMAETSQIYFLSATYEGKAPDKSRVEIEGSTFPPGRCLEQNMGVQGYFCEEITILQPKAKAPWRETHPRRESGQSCHLVHPPPYRTRD